MNIEFGVATPSSAYWVLMTKGVIPGSESLLYNDIQMFVQREPQYEVPDLLSATVGILAHYVRTGERLFSFETQSRTLCRESVGRYQMSVGLFSWDWNYGAKLDVTEIKYHRLNRIGVAALRKFF